MRVARLGPTLGTLAIAWVATGCGRDLTPAWGFDTVTLTPDGAERVQGLQAWQIYGDRWLKRQSKRHYICGVLVEFTGTPTAPACDGCTHAWEITPAVIDSDCDEALLDQPAFTSLQRVGVGALPTTDDPVPYLGLTVGGYADYGAGWEVHGWAYPEALDFGGAGPTGGWNGDAPFTLWPLYAVPLSSD